MPRTFCRVPQHSPALRYLGRCLRLCPRDTRACVSVCASPGAVPVGQMRVSFWTPDGFPQPVAHLQRRQWEGRRLPFALVLEAPGKLGGFHGLLEINKDRDICVYTRVSVMIITKAL